MSSHSAKSPRAAWRLWPQERPPSDRERDRTLEREKSHSSSALHGAPQAGALPGFASHSVIRREAHPQKQQQPHHHPRQKQKQQQQHAELAQGDSEDFVSFLERMQENTDAEVKELRGALEREAARRQQLVEENDQLRKALKDQMGHSQSVLLARLEKKLEEAQREKARVEEELQDTRMELERLQDGVCVADDHETQAQQSSPRTQPGESGALAVTAAKAGALRSSPSFSRRGQLAQVLEEAKSAKAENESLRQQVFDLQSSLAAAKQEAVGKEAEMGSRLQQLRAEARRAQGAMLEKSNEIGALHRKLAQKANSAEMVMKMTLELMVVRHSRHKLEEELKVKNRELDALRAAAHGTGCGEPVVHRHQADQPTDGPGGSDEQDLGEVTGGAADDGEEEQEQETEQGSIQEEVRSSNARNMQCVEKRLEELREEVEARKQEVVEKEAEVQQLQWHKGEMQAELESLRKAVHAAPADKSPPNGSADSFGESAQAEAAEMAQVEVEELREELNKCRTQLANAEDMLKHKQASQEHQPQQQQQQEEEVEQLRSTLAQAEVERDAAVAHTQSLQAVLAAAQEEKISLQQSLDEHQELLGTATADNKKLEEDLLQRDKEIQEYYTKTQAYVAQYWEEKQSAVLELEETKERYVELEQELADKEKELLEAKAAADAELSQHMETAGGQMRRLMQAEMEEVRAQRNQLQTELDGSQQQLLKKNQRVSQLEETFADLSADLQKEVTAHNSTKQQLVQEIEELQDFKKQVHVMDEFQRVVLNLLIPDVRKNKSGHRLRPRPKDDFVCRSCNRVKHTVMWKCQRKNCADMFCTECLPNIFP